MSSLRMGGSHVRGHASQHLGLFCAHHPPSVATLKMAWQHVVPAARSCARTPLPLCTHTSHTTTCVLQSRSGEVRVARECNTCDATCHCHTHMGHAPRYESPTGPHQTGAGVCAACARGVSMRGVLRPAIWEPFPHTTPQPVTTVKMAWQHLAPLRAPSPVIHLPRAHTHQI